MLEVMSSAKLIQKVALVALLLTIAGNASAAAILYGGNSVRAFTVDDTATGAMTEIPYSPSYDIDAIARDQSSGLLYAGNDLRFFSIDASTGTTNVISTGGFTIAGLAFVGSTLYGGNDSRFFSIDTTTGVMTSINASIDFNINAMAYDSINDILYGGNDSGRFFSIDALTGNMTNIGTGARTIRGMAIDPITGDIYGGNTGNNLFTINASTGVQTDLTTSTDYTITALTFAEDAEAIPTPAPILGMLLGGLLMRAARKRVR
ncbi:MAG: hypothetical protein ACPGU7_11065 [Gammaproteobacteria bacterium]